jgi:type II secretory pathway pseudopilin PulG
MCARRRGSGFSLAELVIVVVILGLVGAVVVPQFSRAGVATQEDQLSEQLRTVRAAVELYRAQHHDAAPDLSKDWTPLTSRTDADGRIVSATEQSGGVAFGPYLPTPPVNAMTGGNRVSESPDRGVDWWWDSSTGTVSALDGNGISVVVQPQQQESSSSSSQ